MADSALLVQLLDMGFEVDQIEACQLALASSNSPLTLQAATEWLLQQGTGSGQHRGVSSSVSGTKPYQPSAVSDIKKATSSGAALASPAEPLRSRYDLGMEHQKGKERFMAKERDDAIRSARRMRMAEAQAKAQIKQQIAEDRKRRSELSSARSGHTSSILATTTTTTTPSTTTSSSSGATTNKSVKTTANQTCRVQVRLPNGKVLRNNFPSNAILGDISRFVVENVPSLGSVQLVQPFPHKEFTEEENQCSLQSLGLCPSASLVVSKQPATTQASTTTSSSSVVSPPNKSGTHSSDDEHMDTSEPSKPLHHPHILPHSQPLIRDNKEEEEEEVVEEEEEEEEEEGDDNDNMDQNAGAPHYPPHQRHHHHRQQLPPPFGRGNPFLPPARQMLGGFGGEGHRLGGKEHPMNFGDPQDMSKYVTNSARVAAQKRAQVLSITPASKTAKMSPSLLEVLCLKELTRWSSVHCLPSCASLPPGIAHRLLTALAEAKQLHPKTFNAFLKCPIQSLVLDNYSLATNQLLDMVRCFPSLQHISLVSCGLVTDRGVAQLLPSLPQLTHLNLSGCHQLSDKVFQEFRGTASQQLKVVRLSQLKLTDQGVEMFLRRPLVSLTELDLSSTLITSAALNSLSTGAPNLHSLNIESTKISDIYPLLHLSHLHTLSIANCPLQGKLQPLADLQSLTSLSLSGISLEADELTALLGLQLKSLLLPDRNVFFDEHLQVVAGLPLSSLNLAGYCNITDYGVANLHRMIGLTDLDLSRTKLTDAGMPHLQHLMKLSRLSMDSTIITDEGIMFIAGLENLEDLSLSDTHLSSKFILSGALCQLKKLHKLNLVRTAVDDEGLLHISLPSLMMLNIDWTCTSEDVTLESLRASGCWSLETLRNRNIKQPLPSWMKKNDDMEQ